MEFVASIFILLSTLHILSFAKYNWSKKNKTAAVGAVILGIVSIALPAIVMFAM